MNVDEIKNGFVIDHIKAGQGMEIYRFLGLEHLDCPIAIIKNALSRRMERKDIIKVDTAAEPETFDVAKGPFCLVFGTEHAGVSDEIIEAADEYLRIPMCGMVESLNVSASAAILIYMLSQRMRLTPSIDWQLKDDDVSKMLFRWVMSSVKDSERILQRQFPW